MNQTISSHSETSTKIGSWENPEFPSHERKQFFYQPEARVKALRHVKDSNDVIMGTSNNDIMILNNDVIMET